MNENNTKKPFFARLLEAQALEAAREQHTEDKPYNGTLKYPSDSDEYPDW